MIPGQYVHAAARRTRAGGRGGARQPGEFGVQRRAEIFHQARGSLPTRAASMSVASGSASRSYGVMWSAGAPG